MIVSVAKSLKPLLESCGGIHLTSYLENKQNTYVLRQQLKETIDKAYEYLYPVMNPEDSAKFLDPIVRLIDDEITLNSFRGNVGIFRTETSFRILNIPVEVEQTCVVATTFHVKPLLRWLQVDQDFLFLGVEANCAQLYQGDQKSLNLVDKINLPTQASTHDSGAGLLTIENHLKNKMRIGAIADWLNDTLLSLTGEMKPRLYIAGIDDNDSLARQISYSHISHRHNWPTYEPEKLAPICNEIRAALRMEARKSLKNSLLEFYHTEELSSASQNIFKIAKATMQGKVRKLFIADDISIYGKLNRKSGALEVHPTQYNHQDDDILDDLAQEVLAKGGKVVVASKEEMPMGRPVLAIMKRFSTELHKGYTMPEKMRKAWKGNSIEVQAPAIDWRTEVDWA